MNWKWMGAAGLVAASLVAAPAWAGDADDPVARKELESARKEVEKAREELQKATRELARSLAKVEINNPRVQYFEYMTDPRRAVLGVLIDDESEKRDDPGVRLLAVTPGSGADKAGLRAGDLVLSMNGRPLAREGKTTPQKQMREVLKTLKAGDEVKVEYQRDGKKKVATVVTTAPEPELAMAPSPGMLEEWLRDEDFEKYGSGAMSAMPMFHFRGPAIRGLELCKLDEDLGTYFKTTDGVLVVKAPKTGALSLKSGDVIQKIDGAAVSEPVTVLDKLRSRSDEQSVKLEIVRQGRKMELSGKIPVADARDPTRKETRRKIVIEGGAEDDEGR
jgi:C-terminal processing protease CtpA/Prc